MNYGAFLGGSLLFLVGLFILLIGLTYDFRNTATFGILYGLPCMITGAVVVWLSYRAAKE